MKENYNQSNRYHHHDEYMGKLSFANNNTPSKRYINY